MRSGIYIINCLFVLVSVGCSTRPTRYEPAGESQLGYRDVSIGENQFRVVFRGNSATSRETVENYLLYRAAELARENGFKYFVVDERATATEYAESVLPVYGYYPFGNPDCIGMSPSQCWRFPYYAYDYSWGYPARLVTHKRYEAVAYISLRNEEKSENGNNVYEAEAVIKNLGPLIKRPKS